MGYIAATCCCCFFFFVIMLLAKDFLKNKQVLKKLGLSNSDRAPNINTRNIKKFPNTIKLMKPDCFGWKQSKIDPYIGLTVCGLCDVCFQPCHYLADNKVFRILNTLDTSHHVSECVVYLWQKSCACYFCQKLFWLDLIELWTYIWPVFNVD